MVEMTSLMDVKTSQGRSYLIESVWVMAMEELTLLGLRGDKCETVLPQECRRSGLNEGTMRKWRWDDIEEDNEEFRWSRSPRDMTTAVSFRALPVCVFLEDDFNLVALKNSNHRRAAARDTLLLIREQFASLFLFFGLVNTK